MKTQMGRPQERWHTKHLIIAQILASFQRNTEIVLKIVGVFNTLDLVPNSNYSQV